MGISLLFVALWIQIGFGDYPPAPAMQLIIVLSSAVFSAILFYSLIIGWDSDSLFIFFLFLYVAAVIFFGVKFNAVYKEHLLNTDELGTTLGKVGDRIDTRPPSVSHMLAFDELPCVVYHFSIGESNVIGVHCDKIEKNLPKSGETITVEYSLQRNDVFRVKNP